MFRSWLLNVLTPELGIGRKIDITTGSTVYAGSQFRLCRLQAGHQHVADIAGRFVQVEAHSVAAKFLGNDVELDTVANQSQYSSSSAGQCTKVQWTEQCGQYSLVLVDHIGNTPPLVNDLAPTVAIEVLRA